MKSPAEELTTLAALKMRGTTGLGSKLFVSSATTVLMNGGSIFWGELEIDLSTSGVREPIALPGAECLAVAAEDVRHLKTWAHVRRSLRRYSKSNVSS
jgi:hypothetical protein